jgi:glycosyltransferase involved in cell wall biosynthesis
MKDDKIKVLMIGPARSVKGGMTTVVDNYYNYGLDRIVDLKYIETCNDSNKISKFLKEKKGMMEFKKEIDNFDIVHIHMASRRSTFRKAKYIKLAKKHNKKIVLHIHGAGYKNFYDECDEKKKKYVRDILALCDRIIVLSEEWYDFFKNLVEQEKLVVVYNSIVVPDDFEKNINTNSILFLGRIGKRKGIYDLIEVIEKVIPKYPNLKLYIGGDGEVEKLKKIIKERNLENNVEYIGWTSGEKKNNFLRNVSFYILPSYNEGMPMSVLEGMAYKNITISTNVGGIPKVIEHEKNGIIIEPGDKEKMEMYILHLLEDEKFRKKLSDEARKTIVEKFNIEVIIKKLEEIYTYVRENKE